MSQPFIGQVIAVGFNFAPVGWALCQGQLLAISENDALFALLGTTFGGDGQTTGPSRARRARHGQRIRIERLCYGAIGRHRVGYAHKRSDRKPHPWAGGGGHGDNGDPFVVRRPRHARCGDADLRDGRSWRDADSRRGVYGPGRRTAARKPAAELDHKLHHQPLRNLSVTELNRRRRGGRRADATLYRSDHPFPV